MRKLLPIYLQLLTRWLPLPSPTPELVSFSFGFFNPSPLRNQTFSWRTYIVCVDFRFGTPTPPPPRPKIVKKNLLTGNFSCIPEGYRLVRSCPESDLQVPIVDKFLLKIGSERSTALPCSYTQYSELNTIVDSFILLRNQENKEIFLNVK